MKKIILTLLLTAVSFAQTQKIGFVDSQVIFKTWSVAIKVQSDFDGLTRQWQQTLDQKLKDLQTVYQNYQQQAQTMTEDNLKAAEQDLMAKQKEIEDYRNSKFGQPDGELYSKEKELFEPVRLKIRKAIEEVAKKEGFSFVFDKTENIPILLYGDESFDITFKVLDKLKTSK